KVGELWLAKRETGSRKNDDESRGDGDRAVYKTRRLQAAQPALRAAPAPGAERGRQDCIEKLRRRLNLRQALQSTENMRNTGDQRRLSRPPSSGLLVLHHGHLVVQRVRKAIALRPAVMVNQ